MNFPSSPTDGQTVSEGYKKWVWVAATGTWDAASTIDQIAADAAQSAADAAAAVDALSNTSGSSLIGHIATGTGAVARTVQGKLAEQLPSILDFIPVNLHAGIKARTDVTDLTTYIVAAYAAHKVVYWPAGRYHSSTSINLTSIFGAGIVGDSWNASPSYSTGATEIIITGTNIPGLRLYGPVRVENVYVAYQTQQTSSHTESRTVEFNDISNGYIQNVKAYRGHTNFGIPQAAFSGTDNFLFSTQIGNLYSHSASVTHYDWRNFSGGGTNTKFGPLYMNGGGSLDFVTPGLDAEYAMRVASESNYTFESISIDGQRFTGTNVLDFNQCTARINDLRFEGCNLLANTAYFVGLTGTYASLSIGDMTIQNTKWTPSAAAALYLFRSYATTHLLNVERVYIKSDCAFGSSGTRRILSNVSTVGGGSSRVDIGPVIDEGARLSDVTAWVDSSAVERDMSVFTYNGRVVKEYVQGGRIGNRPLIQYLNALPTTGTYIVGDRVRLTLTTADKLANEYICITAGTPGTWRSISHVVGKGATGSRPTLGASDVGVIYLDTTLASYGQPIIWDGSAWIVEFPASSIGFTPAGTGVVTTTVQTKIREWVSVKDYGAVGDDATDNDDFIRACFLEASATGRGILIPPGIYRMAKPLDFLTNTSVIAHGATLKITADPTAAGGFLIIKATDDNIDWQGGTIDGGGLLGLTNMNGIAAAYDPVGSTTSKNIRFSNMRVVNCRTDAAMDAITPFSGGGKGVTLQFHINGAIFNDIIVEDCDIPFSVEAAVSNVQYAENMVLSNFICRNCTRGPFFSGSKPTTTSSLDDWGYEESRLGQAVLRNIVLDNCGTESALYGAITANYANCLDAEFIVRNSNDSSAKVTLWRGNVTHSRIRIQAFVDNLRSAVNLVPYTGASLSTLTSAGYDIMVEAHVADSISDVLIKGDDVRSTRGRIRVDYYHDTVPTLMSGFVASASTKYAFWDMRTGKQLSGSTELSIAPSMANVSRVGFMDQDTDFANGVRIGFTGTGNSYVQPIGTSLDLRDSSGTARASVSSTGLNVPTLVNYSRSDLTIAAGSITATRTRHRIDTEGAAASDDLDTIVAGTDGQRLRLYCVSGTRVITVKNGTGNLKLADGDFILNNVADCIEFEYHSPASSWLEVSRSTNDLTVNLALSTGSSLVGHIATGTGAVARTVQTKLREFQITPQDFGAVGDGVADDSAAIQAMIDAMTSGKAARFPYGQYRCLTKLRIGKGTPINSLVFKGDMGGYLEVAGAPVLFLDPASADSTLFELDQANDVRFIGMTLKGKGAGVAGSYVLTATDLNADVDVVFDQCTIGNAETIVKVTGRGLLVQNSSLVFATHGFELVWPSPFTSLGNEDHYTGSGMRGYRIVNNRIHGWSGGYLVKNIGANAHYIRSVHIANNYADTNMRMWDGHINDTVIIGNEVLHTRGGDGTLPLFDIDADLNAVGGVVNKNVTIIGNYFGGQHDTTYMSGGNPSVVDRWFGSFGSFANMSGLKIKGNTFNRSSRSTITLVDVDNFDISGNTFRDVGLDAARTLVLTGVTGRYVKGETVTGGTSAATGVVAYTAIDTLRLNSVTGTFQAAETVTGGTSAATGTVSTTSLTARYPILLNSGDDFSRGYIGENHLITEHTGNSAQFVRTTGATITDLRFGELFYDSTKWGLTDYIGSLLTNVNDDTVFTKVLKAGDGAICILAADAATMETSSVVYKRSGTDAIGILADPSSVYSVATTGVLTGTTGTDTKLNVSVVESSGVVTLYVENRRGGTRAIGVLEL